MKILEAVIKFGKAFTKLTTVGQVAVVGALMYLGYAAGSCGNKAKDTDNIEVVVEQTKKRAKDLEDQVDSLQKNVAQKETTITTLKFQISLRQKERNQIRQELKTLEQQATQERMVAMVPTPLTDSLINGLKTEVAKADTVIQIQEDVITTREQQIKMLNDALYLSNQRGDTLQVALDQTLKAYQKKDKLFGKIPMPSRKTVAAIAFIGGAYVGVQAAR